MPLYQLAVEIEQDDCGYHSLIIDVPDDAVLQVSNTFVRPEDAERAAHDWINNNA